MKHIEQLYRNLQQGRTRKLKPEGIYYIINKIRAREPKYNFLRTKSRGKLQIKKAQLVGNITKYKNVYVSKPSELTFRVEYYNAGRTARALVYQQISEAKAKQTVIFGGGATYKLELKHKFEKPEKLLLIADIRSRRWRTDSHFEKVLTMGLADNRPRPIATFPEPSAENEVLDIRTEWKEGTGVYPEQLPEGIETSVKPVKFVSGLFKWDTSYRIPLEPAKVELSYTVKNNTGAKLRVEEWNLMVAILYEDMRHMSYGNVVVGYEPRTVDNKKSTTYTFEVALPEWVYGYVTITHAMRFYKGEMFVYGGGPIWNFKLGRVLLP